LHNDSVVVVGHEIISKCEAPFDKAKQTVTVLFSRHQVSGASFSGPLTSLSGMTDGFTRRRGDKLLSLGNAP